MHLSQVLAIDVLKRHVLNTFDILKNSVLSPRAAAALSERNEHCARLDERSRRSYLASSCREGADRSEVSQRVELERRAHPQAE